MLDLEHSVLQGLECRVGKAPPQHRAQGLHREAARQSEQLPTPIRAPRAGVGVDPRTPAAPHAPSPHRSAESVGDLGQITDSDQYLGELEAGVHDDLPGDNESLELLTELELRDDETDDAFTASDEGMTYVPPIDPPTC